MEFKEQLPVWKAEGVAPPETKQNEGWQIGDKPPADWFNYMWSRTYYSLDEIREKMNWLADNSGKVETVNNVKPDSNKNIKLTGTNIAYKDGITENIATKISKMDTEIDTVKQSGVESNKILVDALNSKKVQASTDDSIKVNASKVNDIVLKDYAVGENIEINNLTPIYKPAVGILTDSKIYPLSQYSTISNTGKILVGTVPGMYETVILTPDGKITDKFDISEEVKLVIDDRYIIASQFSNVYCYDISSKSRKWSVTVGETVSGIRYDGSNSLFVSTRDSNEYIGRVCRVSLSTGEKIWEYGPSRDVRGPNISVNPSRTRVLLTGNKDVKVRLLNYDTGNVVRTFDNRLTSTSGTFDKHGNIFLYFDGEITKRNDSFSIITNYDTPNNFESFISNNFLHGNDNYLYGRGGQHNTHGITKFDLDMNIIAQFNGSASNGRNTVVTENDDIFVSYQYGGSYLVSGNSITGYKINK